MSTKITSVRTYTKGEGESAKQLVCINNNIHISQKQLNGLGYKNPKALIGSEISVVFYKEGEEMFNKQKCSKADTIVKSFEITDSAEDLRYAKLANAGVIVQA